MRCFKKAVLETFINSAVLFCGDRPACRTHLCGGALTRLLMLSGLGPAAGLAIIRFIGLVTFNSHISI